MQVNTTEISRIPGNAAKLVNDNFFIMPDVQILSQPVPIIQSKISNTFYLSVKRALDIIISLIVLTTGFPLMLLVGVAIKVDSIGPIIYKQKRLGKDGKQFTLYKFRSMKVDAESIGAKWAEKNDERVTRVGSVIRKIRLDELPQLINILHGDMSIVGPRPERGVFYEEFEKVIPGFKQRLYVKPGLTGWAQVNGGYELRPDEKILYDLEYINNQSLYLDFKCIYKTIKVVLMNDGAR